MSVHDLDVSRGCAMGLVFGVCMWSGLGQACKRSVGLLLDTRTHMRSGNARVWTALTLTHMPRAASQTSHSAMCSLIRKQDPS